MSEFLLEFFGEEIPAAMQTFACTTLERLMKEKLKTADLSFSSMASYATPRRISLVVEGLPLNSKDTKEERKGPRVDAPKQALEGFLRGSGLKSLDDCTIQEDKKGQFYVAVIEKKGAATQTLLASIINEILPQFPWPKSMRWGNAPLKWVRPLHNILALFDGKTIDFEGHGFTANNQSFGHRFLAPDAFTVTDFKSYQTDLAKRFVMLKSSARATTILSQANTLAKKAGLALLEDEALLYETAGLVEWPIVLMGSFDESFLDVPNEIITLALKSHQKCFSLQDTKTKKLANQFLLVANIEAHDKGAKIIQGNERVVHARLSDAKFFWDNDKKTDLKTMAAKLDDIVFHKEIGSIAQRVTRISAIASYVANQLGGDVNQAKQAAQLCKADLVSQTVYESPGLQGLIGKYCGQIQSLPQPVCDAMADHYKPQGPSDKVPTHPISISVAMADKLDMLTSFWMINQKPTGSRDPFGLRRAALGVIRMILENELSLPLKPIFQNTLPSFDKEEDLLAFFQDRLGVYLRGENINHDVLNALFSVHANDDILKLSKASRALQSFLSTSDGEALKAGIKRAVNILAIEEKKDKTSYQGDYKQNLLSHGAEKTLDKALGKAQTLVQSALDQDDFDSALKALRELRPPIDGFFDELIVNDEDPKRRENRLKLLSAIRQTSHMFADFSALEG